MKVYSIRIKELRIDNKLSQNQLAEKLGTTNSTICDWERGRTEPDLEMLKKLALLFSVSADYIIGLSDD